MEKWILSIVGTVALGVLLDIIMPEGDMSKYIKGVFAIVVITVVVAPLPTFFLSIKNGHIIPPEYGGDLEVDSEFVEYVENEKLATIEAELGRLLMNYDINYNNITINDSKRDDILDEVYIALSNENDINKAREIIAKRFRYRIKEVIIDGSGNR